MSPIHSWNDAYVVLKHRAEEVRGFIELTPGTPERERWPRTTGADVVAIASLVDQHVRRMRSSHGVQGVYRRWRACLGDIERYALAMPGDTFPENRVFWRCLAALFIHLASIQAPLPDPQTWAVLLGELGEALAIRNVGPKGRQPIKQFDVKTFSDLYNEQYKFLRDTRGYDELEPEPYVEDSYGRSGIKHKIPRTTNADVIMLADYWTKQLDDVKEITGHAGTVRRWNAALADVRQHAIYGSTTAVYPKNNAFWRELSHTAIHVSVADEARSKWDLAVDSLKDSIKKLPDRLATGAGTIASGAAAVAGDIAHGAGSIVNRAGQGMFSGFGVPLLVGGGLLGVFLIARSRRRDKEEE